MIAVKTPTGNATVTSSRATTRVSPSPHTLVSCAQWAATSPLFPWGYCPHCCATVVIGPPRKVHVHLPRYAPSTSAMTAPPVPLDSACRADESEVNAGLIHAASSERG